MSVFISRMEIENFKLFDKVTVEFEGARLNVLDGPNGYGKTSFFDAVELLFTGSLSRYKRLASGVVDKREKLNENPLFCHYDCCLRIKAAIKVGDAELFLMRESDQCDSGAVDFEKLNMPLYLLKAYDNTKDKELVSDAGAFISAVLGHNFIKSFNLINYVEQDDSLKLLKAKKTDKQSAISHLFDTGELDAKISKLTEVKKKITANKVEIKEKEESLEGSIRTVSEQLSSVDEIPYIRLIADKDFIWDRSKLTFHDGVYAEWTSPTGQLFCLRKLCENLGSFESVQKHIELRQIVNDRVRLATFFKYYYFIHNAPRFSQLLDIHTRANELFTSFDDPVEFIKSGKYVLDDGLKEIVKDSIDVNSYTRACADLSGLIKQEGDFNTAVAELGLARDKLASAFGTVSENSDSFLEREKCPFCGYGWNDAEELAERIDNQKLILAEYAETYSKKVSEALERFRIEFIDPAFQSIRKYLHDNQVSPRFLNEAIRLSSNREMYAEIYNLLLRYIEEINSYFNRSQDVLFEFDFSDFDSKIGLILSAQDNIFSLHDFDVFNVLFDGDIAKLKNIQLADVDRKIQYITYQHQLSQNLFIQTKAAELKSLNEQSGKVAVLEKDFAKLIRTYKDARAEYIKQVAFNIEIYFYIYSGRIIQDYPGGLGLFIDTDKKVKFLTDCSKSYDAVFYMSSGQLSALIIAFTLALNKKYSTSKLLLIDDPVQTLDEINIAGLVDVLRNDFSDRQIFLSTHEDKMSMFMRYKFEKFNIKTKRINFKELLA
ncbi:AAA family ATPase [Maridesulfovibrio sp.]|uniref:AAA family ATPase n=1 Tax=Maridesulfovibrio sp. TaxID=2795000 RepID=UPI003B007FA1